MAEFEDIPPDLLFEDVDESELGLTSTAGGQPDSGGNSAVEDAMDTS